MESLTAAMKELIIKEFMLKTELRKIKHRIKREGRVAEDQKDQILREGEKEIFLSGEILEMFIDDYIDITDNNDDYITTIDMYNNFIYFCGKHHELKFERPKTRLSFLSRISRILPSIKSYQKRLPEHSNEPVTIKTGLKWK